MGFSINEFKSLSLWLWYGAFGIVFSMIGAWMNGKWGATIPYAAYLLPAALAVVLAVAMGNVFPQPHIKK